jgi:hypothetical protein
VALHAQNRECHEKEDDRKGRDERGHPQIACGIVNLHPGLHIVSTPGYRTGAWAGALRQFGAFYFQFARFGKFIRPASYEVDKLNTSRL